MPPCGVSPPVVASLRVCPICTVPQPADTAFTRNALCCDRCCTVAGATDQSHRPRYGGKPVSPNEQDTGCDTSNTTDCLQNAPSKAFQTSNLYTDKFPVPPGEKLSQKSSDRFRKCLACSQLRSTQSDFTEKPSTCNECMQKLTQRPISLVSITASLPDGGDGPYPVLPARPAPVRHDSWLKNMPDIPTQRSNPADMPSTNDANICSATSMDALTAMKPTNSTQHPNSAPAYPLTNLHPTVHDAGRMGPPQTLSANYPVAYSWPVPEAMSLPIVTDGPSGWITPPSNQVSIPHPPVLKITASTVSDQRAPVENNKPIVPSLISDALAKWVSSKSSAASDSGVSCGLSATSKTQSWLASLPTTEHTNHCVALSSSNSIPSLDSMPTDLTISTPLPCSPISRGRGDVTGNSVDCSRLQSTDITELQDPLTPPVIKRLPVSPVPAVSSALLRLEAVEAAWIDSIASSTALSPFSIHGIPMEEDSTPCQPASQVMQGPGSIGAGEHPAPKADGHANEEECIPIPASNSSSGHGGSFSSNPTSSFRRHLALQEALEGATEIVHTQPGASERFEGIAEDEATTLGAGKAHPTVPRHSPPTSMVASDSFLQGCHKTLAGDVGLVRPVVCTEFAQSFSSSAGTPSSGELPARSKSVSRSKKKAGSLTFSAVRTGGVTPPRDATSKHSKSRLCSSLPTVPTIPKSTAYSSGFLSPKSTERGATARTSSSQKRSNSPKLTMTSRRSVSPSPTTSRNTDASNFPERRSPSRHRTSPPKSRSMSPASRSKPSTTTAHSKHVGSAGRDTARTRVPKGSSKLTNADLDILETLLKKSFFASQIDRLGTSTPAVIPDIPPLCTPSHPPCYQQQLNGGLAAQNATSENPTVHRGLERAEPQCHSLKKIRRRGQGGQSVIWEVEYNGALMVAKYPLEPLSACEVQKMMATAVMQQSVQHPNVLQVMSIIPSDPGPCVILERASHDISDLFCKEGISPIRQWELALGVAKGLQALHSASPPIIHRDIKATNIFVTDDLIPKVADFDFAVQSDVPVEGHYGTPGFMAPEVLLDQPYDTKVDIFSFASLLYELSHSNAPFWFELDESFKKDSSRWGRAVTGLMLEGHRPPLNPAKCKPKMSLLIEKCWAHCPAHRPTIDAIVQELEEMKDEFMP